jgi:hypothetical protein
MKQQSDQIDKLTIEARDLDRQWARCQRFLYRTESIARAANLSLVAGAGVQHSYRRLIELETGRFQPAGKVASDVSRSATGR